MLGGFGIAGFGADRVGEALEAEKRLTGDGYTRADGSVRVEELASWAHLFAVGMAAMDAAERSMFVRSAVELLDTWERVTGAPNNAGDAVQDRQERLHAFFQLLGRPTDYALVLGKMGITVQLDPNTYISKVEDEAATPGAIFVTSVLASEVTVEVERLVRWVLRAAFPVVAWGSVDRSDPVDGLVSYDTATWAGGQVIDQARLAAAPTLAQERPRSRFRDWCHYSSVRSRDLNELQWRTLLAASAGVTQGTPATRSMWFTCSIANATSKDVSLAGGDDFRRRLVRVLLRVATTDVRPGQAGDTAFNGASSSSSLWYTGTGGASYVYAAGGGIELSVSAVDGHIILTNGSGGTRYVTIWLEASGPTNVGTSGAKPALVLTSAPPNFQTFASAGIDASWYSTMRAALAQRAANGSGADAWSGFPTTQYGGLVRMVSLGASTRPASGATTHYADRTVDWRDRLLAVFAVGVDDAHGALGAPADAQETVASLLIWTGDGIGVGNATLQPYAAAVGNFRVGVDALTGALVIEHHTGSSWAQVSCTLIVHATDQLGKRTSATPLAMPTVAVDTVAMNAGQLNFLQDLAMMSQGRGRDGDEPWFTQSVSDDSWATLSASMLSFGAELEGWSDTKVPKRFDRAFADGKLRARVDVVTGRTTQERRDHPQAAFGRVRRVLAASVANGATSDVDSTESWVDRVIVAWISVSSSDIRPGQASDSLLTTNAQQVAFYAGSGDREIELASSSVFVRVSADGVLQVRNASGGTRYVAGWVEASFECGCS